MNKKQYRKEKIHRLLAFRGTDSPCTTTELLEILSENFNIECNRRTLERDLYELEADGDLCGISEMPQKWTINCSHSLKWFLTNEDIAKIVEFIPEESDLYCRLLGSL